jgi:hypothetical protein
MGDGIGAFGFWLAVGAGSAGLFFGPIGRALGHWIQAHSRRIAPGPEEDAARGEQALRFSELEGRLGELEERLDFTERVLAQHRQQQLDDADTPPEALPAAGTR